MEIKNNEYNFLRKRLKRLEEVYKQSCDLIVRNAVKETTLYDIEEGIPGFYDTYAEKFEECKMESLKEVLDLTDEILGNYTIEKLPKIEVKEAKKIFKVKERALNAFVKAYNAAVEKENLSYFSQRVDDKLLLLTYEEGEFLGAVASVQRNRRNKEALCPFCKQFRRGEDIVFMTTNVKEAKSEFAVVGQYCCSEYEICNRDIEEIESVKKFIRYSYPKNKNKK